MTGGALIIVGEDYGEGSSIMQERSHAFAMKSQIWLIDPRPNLPSIVKAVEKGFELSEASNTPVMLELRIRACHVYGSFPVRDNTRPGFTLKDALERPVRDANRIVLLPASYLQESDKIEKRWPAAVRFIQEQSLNELFDGDAGDIGIVMQGGLYNSMLRALWARQVSCLVRAGKYHEAQVCAAETEKAGLGSPELWLAQGEALAKLGHHDTAISQLARVVEARPHNQAAWLHLGTCSLLIGQPQKALEQLECALKLSDSLEASALVLSTKGTALNALGRESEASSCALTIEAMELSSDGNFSAFEKLREAISLDTSNWYARRVLGDLLLQTDDIQGACDVYSKVLESVPDDDVLWTTLGASLQTIGRITEAISCHHKALKQNPQSGMALRNLASVYGDLERFEDALPFLEKAISIEPENFNAWYLRGCCQARLGNLPNSVHALRQATRFNSSDWEAWSL